MPESKKSPRLIARGDVVRIDDDREEVVRSVTVVLHLANGEDRRFVEGEQVMLVDAPRPVTKDEVDAVERKERPAAKRARKRA